MTTELPPHLGAWEKDYSQRGALQRGAGKWIPPLPAGARVLELGCGNGKTAASLSLQPIELYAIDSSSAAVKLCQERVEQVSGKAIVKQMDGTSLEYQSGFFDAVFCYHYLAHMPKAEREQAALEAERVLKRGGKLYFKEFGTKDFRVGKGTEVEPNTFKRHGGILTHYFTEEETRKLFPSLQVHSFESEQWRVTLRGKEYPREMLHAIFGKAKS